LRIRSEKANIVADHVIEQGECLASVAAAHGFDWRTLWEHPNNAELKEKRKDPNVLFPGDVVFVPDKEIRKEKLPTGKRHRFVHKGALETLRIRLIDELDRPRTKIGYELLIGDESRTGTTNDDGELIEPIPPHTREAKLNFGGGEITLRIGDLDPPDTISGAQARLTNLGYDAGPCDGIAGPRTSDALRTFQEAVEIEPTGELDDKTIAALRDRHGR
jgi:N-acetylmuramoyl-L-alanine amidase